MNGYNKLLLVLVAAIVFVCFILYTNSSQPCICSTKFEPKCNDKTHQYSESAHCSCDSNAKQLEEGSWNRCDNISYCYEDINSDFKRNCIKNIAFNTNNISLCDFIDASNARVSCQAFVEYENHIGLSK